MAVVSMIVGGMVGCMSALFGLIILNVSWTGALGLWSGVGSLAAVAMLIYAMQPRHPAAQTGTPEHA